MFKFSLGKPKNALNYVIIDTIRGSLILSSNHFNFSKY